MKLTGIENKGILLSLMKGKLEFTSLNNFGNPASIDNGLQYCGDSTEIIWADGNTADLSSKFKSVGSGYVILNTKANNVTFTASIYSYPSFIKIGTGNLTFGNGLRLYKGIIREGTVTTTASSYAETGNEIFVEPTGKLVFSVANGSTIYSQNVIKGTGPVEKTGRGILELAAQSTHTGTITVKNGLLRIGSEYYTGSIQSNVVLEYLNVANNGNLEFTRYPSTWKYAGVISGEGNVTKSASWNLYLTGQNTFSGNLTITDGKLVLDTTGTVANAIVNLTGTGKFEVIGDKDITGLKGSSTTGEVIIHESLEVNRGIAAVAVFDTVKAKLTGAGNLIKSGRNTLVLTNTSSDISGELTVYAGVVGLGIESLSPVSFGSINLTRARGSIYSGNLKLITNTSVKSISAAYASNEVDLNGKTLAIGSTGSANGSGNFKGAFVGEGQLIKRGTETFVLSGMSTNLFTSFLLYQGKLSLNGAKIQGSLMAYNNFAIEISDSVYLRDLMIYNTNESNSLKFNLLVPTTKLQLGADFANYTTPSYKTTIDVVTNQSVTNRVLVESATINANNTLDKYQLQMEGLDASLSMNSTQLLLTAHPFDVTPPTVANADITIQNWSTTHITVRWTKATDDYTADSNIVYYVYRSLENNIGSVSDCEVNGELLNPEGMVAGNWSAWSYKSEDLTPNTAYYFNVIAQDNAGNKTAYNGAFRTTLKATLKGSAVIEGTPVFENQLSFRIDSLASNPTIADLGEFAYEWHRTTPPPALTDEIIGTNATYNISAADIGAFISLKITTANTTGVLQANLYPEVIKAAAPAADPAVAEVITNHSIQLYVIGDNYRYRIEGGDWQTSTLFEDLEPETNYIFYTKTIETATHFESAETVSAAIGTLAEPEPDKVYQGIVAVEPISLPYNTAPTVEAFTLPVTVGINTDNGVVNNVVIIWNLNDIQYTQGIDPEQSFTVCGTITLPATGVVNPDAVSLQTCVQITVAARPLNPYIALFSVSPPSVSLNAGQNQQFASHVVAYDGADETAAWTLIGNVSASTTLSNNGYLSVAGDEPTGTLKVIATSNFDNNFKDTAEVSITNIPITPAVNSVNIVENNPSIAQTASFQFHVEVDAVGGADASVTWTVYNAYSAETTIENGLLTIGANEQSANLLVWARSAFNENISDYSYVTVTVVSGIHNLYIFPEEVDAYPEYNVSATAICNTTGDAVPDVTWTMSGNNSANTILAPTSSISVMLSLAADETASQIYLTATSVYEPSKSATAVVNVLQFPRVIDLHISPASAFVEIGNSLQFETSVETLFTEFGAIDETIAYYVSGSNNYSGQTTIGQFDGLLHVAYDEQAPTVTVTAYSLANNNISAEAIVTVTRPAAINGISIDPNMTDMQLGEGKQFIATVDAVGGANPSVIWSIEDAGSPNTTVSNGYVVIGEDESAQTIYVKARSVFNSGVTAIASVSIIGNGYPTVLNFEQSTNLMNPDEGFTFTYKIEGQGSFNEAVVWDIEGQESAETYIEDGYFYVAEDELADTITVKITSVADPTLVATIDVTIYHQSSAITLGYKFDFVIYPNPVSTTLNVQCAMQNAQCVEIYDIAGKLHSTLHFGLSTKEINVVDLKKGVYFLKIGDVVKKFVKE
ncbi:hypothetical protein FACS1894180_2860 [Bacteroidia bacterium]|nr:hypothetical protein FACS1894180_2860 [Bacteroidia bacterium]